MIPRDAVNTLSVKEFRGKWGRSVGVSLGIITGITYGGYAAIAGTNSAAAGLPTFLAITGAATIAGYYLGKSADRRAKRIRVIP
ncbi:MAG: hypothetical protein ABI833_07745 [Acidobacteriota bacterium]